MEKQADEPGMTPEYCDLDFDLPFNMWEAAVGSTGRFFCGGTVGGFIYNLIKVSVGVRSRLGAALGNAPRVGGFCALFSLSTEVSGLVLDALPGEGKDNKRTDILACSAGAAIMWSPRGLRSASLAALAAAGFPMFALGVLALDTSFSTLHKTNTYSYPHYRPKGFCIHRPFPSIQTIFNVSEGEVEYEAV